MKIESPNVRSEINVTPLVDVVLVLLIIFMVVTPMLQKGRAVRLPVTNNPEKKADDKNQVLVAINVEKQIWIDKDQVPENAFDAKVKEIFERNPGSTIMVKADSRLTFGDVKKLVFKIRDAGFTRVGLITEKRSQT